MVSFTDHYNDTSIGRLPSESKIGKGSWCFNNFFYVSPSSPVLQSRFKENGKLLSKNSTTQKNITIARQNLLYY